MLVSTFVAWYIIVIQYPVRQVLLENHSILLPKWYGFQSLLSGYNHRFLALFGRDSYVPHHLLAAFQNCQYLRLEYCAIGWHKIWAENNCCLVPSCFSMRRFCNKGLKCGKLRTVNMINAFVGCFLQPPLCRWVPFSAMLLLFPCKFVCLVFATSPTSIESTIFFYNSLFRIFFFCFLKSFILRVRLRYLTVVLSYLNLLILRYANSS